MIWLSYWLSLKINYKIEVMIKLEDIVRYLDEELRIAEIDDYSGALNGLQLSNDGSVAKIGAAVDASLPVFEKAVANGVDLLVVHHGMFWQGAQKFVGAQYKKLKIALDNNLAVYSAHIPLDIHNEWGNNILLAKALGMHNVERFHSWKGELLGLKQELDISLDELIKRANLALGCDVHVCSGRELNTVGMVGVITGGAGSEVQAMAEAGIDTFITGEGPHWSYPLAEELGINVVYGGHYMTETFGVLKLMEHLAKKYSLGEYYVNHPTGL